MINTVTSADSLRPAHGETASGTVDPTLVGMPQRAGDGCPALEARSLYRFFRAGEEETLALQGVSLSVRPGEVLAVSGPSGSGKSTLLNCLAGLDEPAGGMVMVGGMRLSHRSEGERARIRAARIGVLRQSDNLIPHLSVAANIRFAQLAGAAAQPLHHLDAARRDERRNGTDPAALLDRVGLTRRARALPLELSGGERARAGIAVALANSPDVVLADEPTGELDGHSEVQVLRLLTDLAARGSALIIVTHSQAVAGVADEVMVLTDGRVRS